jgi:arylformamidase
MPMLLSIFSEGDSVDKIPPETFIGEAVILDMSYKGTGQAITDAELNSYSSSVNAREIILLYTGYDPLQEQNNSWKNFSYLEASAARWIGNSKIKCLGIDTFSVERYGYAEGTVHKTLLTKEIGIIEGRSQELKNFVGKRVFLVCLPLLLKGIDGSPARAILFDIV